MSPAFFVRLAAAPAVAVAVNVTGLPLKPVVLAVESIAVPAVVPSCHAVSAAIPELFVATVSGPAPSPPPLLICPLPAVTVNVTFTPCTGLFEASLTSTAGAVPTLAPTVAV